MVRRRRRRRSRGKINATDVLNYDFFPYNLIVSFCNVRSKYGVRHKNHQIIKSSNQKKKKGKKKREGPGLILFISSFTEKAILSTLGYIL